MSSPPLSPRKQFTLPLASGALDHTEAALTKRGHAASVSATANPTNAAKRTANRRAAEKSRGGVRSSSMDQSNDGTQSFDATAAASTNQPFNFTSSDGAAPASLPTMDPLQAAQAVARSHSPIHAGTVLNALSEAMREGVVDAPPMPVAPVITRARPMPTLPPAELASLVRSHVRHVSLSARLKTKAQVRELIGQQKDQKARAVQRAKPRPLKLQQEEKSASPPRTHRSSGDNEQSMFSRLALANVQSQPSITAAPLDSIVPPAPEPVIPWPSWIDVQTSPGTVTSTHVYDDEEEHIWRDQRGNHLGIEATGGGGNNSARTKLVGPPVVVDPHSARMPPIKASTRRPTATSSRFLKGSFAPSGSEFVQAASNKRIY